MFGNPVWFRLRTKGWGVRPVSWQGWAYTLAWAAVLLLPFWGLFARHQVVEGLAWLACSIGLMSLDVRHIRHAILGASRTAVQQHPDIWFLGDEQPATRNYDLRLKK